MVAADTDTLAVESASDVADALRDAVVAPDVDAETSSEAVKGIDGASCALRIAFLDTGDGDQKL